MKLEDRIVYSLNVEDIQTVAEEVLERKLRKAEIALVEGSIGRYVDWFGAIEFAIKENVRKRAPRKHR